MNYLNAEVIQNRDSEKYIAGGLVVHEGTDCFGLPALNLTEAALKMQYANIGTITKTVNQSLLDPYELLKLTYQCRGANLFGYWEWRDTIRFYLKRNHIDPPIPPKPIPTTTKNCLLIIVIVAIVLFIAFGKKK